MYSGWSIIAVLLWLSQCLAFRDTSPLFLFATRRYQRLPHTTSAVQDLATSSDAENRVKAVVCECSSDVHFIISQPGISAYDFAGPDAAPFLRQVMTREDKHIEASLIIPEVVGPVDGKEIARYIESQCHAKRQTWDAASGYIGTIDEFPAVVLIDLPELPSAGAERQTKIRHHDAYIQHIITSLGDIRYTAIYTSTSVPADGAQSVEPSSEQMYQMDEPYPSALHLEMKRDLSSHVDPATTFSTDDRSLFEKYQFLSPGIIMGLLVFFVLLAICYVGISAIASLEVSYGAFAREMGPAAQKKQQ